MRILVVGNYFPPWRGGVETYVYNLCKHLQRRGHEVHVICASPPLTEGIQFVDGVSVERVRVTGTLYGTPIMPELPPRLAREPADIIHANFPTPYNALLTSAISKLGGMPALLTWHNDLLPVTRWARILALAHDRLVVPFYLSRFSFIIATSRLYAENSPVLSAQKERVVVVPHGVDTERFNPSIPGEEVRSRLKLAGAKIVLFVGALTRWHRYKGLDILVRAVALLKKQVPQIRLLVVGRGELETEYRYVADRLGVGKYVIFAGDVPDSELPIYYACSDLLALPSKYSCEGFGLVLLEANAVGKPTIGTTVGGIPSVIENGYNGLLVPPNEPKALAGAIKRLLSDEDLLSRMGKNARRLAEQHPWSLVAEQTENLYRRAAARRLRYA